MSPDGEYATHFSPADEPVTVADAIRAYVSGERTM
jgi:hypothetical protein